MDPNYAESLFNYLYGNINGYEVSTKARNNTTTDTSQFLYGELPFQTFKEIVERINPKLDGVFYDLGSGTGRIVMQAHILYNFKKSVGVEFLEGLHNKAIETKEIFERDVKPRIEKDVAGRELKFVCGDIFNTDYSDADFIFMNHPIKDSGLFLQLEEKLSKELKPGTKIVTIIRALRDPKFKSLGSQIYKFSWGNSTAHFFEV